MYMVSFENAEENYHGPYDSIAMDGTTPDGFIFLCLAPDSSERIIVTGSFQIITGEYYRR